MCQTDADTLMDDVHLQVALVLRLGGKVIPTTATLADGSPHRCQHKGPHGRCNCILDADGIHPSLCQTGGYIIARHDAGVRWIHKWLGQGRTSAPPVLEQGLPDEDGRLDVVFQDDGRTYWLDFAVTNAGTNSRRHVQTNARTDGAAARAEEGVKRWRYHGRALPMVMEAGGRPGASALAFIRAYAQEADEGFSVSASHAWASLSSIIQSRTAAGILAAWGPKALHAGRIRLAMP